MLFEKLAISDVVLITPKKFGDERGYFMETFRANLFAEKIGAFEFVQDNQSLSAERGTVRGLHFQLDPHAQGKLVSCIAGAILDIAVDIRTGSPTFGQHVKAALSAENGCQLWVPRGFAHGFCTLEPNSVISYKVTDYYSSANDRGILWNDPALGIDWPVAMQDAILSSKDRGQPPLSALDANFTYSG
jgi:dTDP-4-dehydrorhamnose 3,5-epimerase